jgi:hypothetical protein
MGDQGGPSNADVLVAGRRGDVEARRSSQLQKVTTIVFIKFYFSQTT